MSNLDPRIVAWRRELRSRGRVELAVRRWPHRRASVVADEIGVWITPGDVHVPWADVVGVSVFSIASARDFVELAVTESFREGWLGRQRRWVRAMWFAELIWRPGVAHFRLPGVRSRDAEILDAFLVAEARRRGRVSPP